MAHPTITNFGLLDPALLQKEIETAPLCHRGHHGHEVDAREHVGGG